MTYLIPKIKQIANRGRTAIQGIPDSLLLDMLNLCNDRYRAGEPIISDHDYDFIFLKELQDRYPEHPYLSTVEPEKAFVGKTVLLPKPMLSTDKTYTYEGIAKWVERAKKAAEELGIEPDSLIYEATPKLDGFAGYDDGEHLYTRGDSVRGTDITRVFERGVQLGGTAERGMGPGEIVVDKTYFDLYLACSFENSRNFQSSVVKEKELDPIVVKAIQDKAVVFYPFAALPRWSGSAVELLGNLSDIIAQMSTLVPYNVDGTVLEVNHPELKEYLGSTHHHHRWQIAFKSNDEHTTVSVRHVIPQTSRSGRINPVAEIEPTVLCGATISRVTAHHYGMVKTLGIGPGAVITLVRSGMVIPKIENVVTKAEPEIPSVCPSCGAEVVWENDYLCCPNTIACPAQTECTIEHFFSTLGNIDGFGESTIHKLYETGIQSVYEIYQLSASDFKARGFGDKTAYNLMNQLYFSKMKGVEDYRFLAAFGIYRLGLSNCEKLLHHVRLLDIFHLTKEQIIAIEGFGEKTAEVVLNYLPKIQEDFLKLYHQGFHKTLLVTPLLSEGHQADSPIAGKTIVFTGTMENRSREVMIKEAKRLGAITTDAVSSKTDYLVIGKDPGASKVKKAQVQNIPILTEENYNMLVA